VTEFSIGDAFSKVIKGLRQEINGIIGEIDRSKNFTLEEMKGLLKNSLEAMVDSVEAVMSGVSDQLAVERKKKEGEESIREERIRGIEEKGGKERKKRDLEKRHYDGKMEKNEQKEQEREEKVRSLKERM
jgi:spore cortex formation protein SpoVR/YcgB (stage V sporulation)